MISIIRKSIPLVKIYPAIERSVIANGTIEPITIEMRRFIRTSGCTFEIDEEDKQKGALTLHSFENVREKRKETFLEIIHAYTKGPESLRGQIRFIKIAMEYMDEFGVNEDLEVYKKLIDILPKGKLIPTNRFQVMFRHYPMHQICIVDLLNKMEMNGVMPDVETQTILLNIFGKTGLPLKKFWRMMYWIPKFKNLNPWPIPKPIPNDLMEIAKLAIKKISSADFRSKMTVYYSKDIEDSIDDTWIVSAISPVQSHLLEKHPKNKAIYVEGPSKVWVGSASVDYFILRADPPKNRKYPKYDIDDVSNVRIPFFSKDEANYLMLIPTVHEQEDGTIFAMCATGTSSKDSLLSWIRSLQNENPVLLKIPIVFRLTSSPTEIVPVQKEYTKQMEFDIDEAKKKISD